MIFGENLYLPSKLRNEATQTWVDNAISSLLNKRIRYMSIKVIIPELKRRAVGRDDAGQRRSDSSSQKYFHRHFVSI